MAMAMDRSKYRNPDMPVGYVKKECELAYKHGVEIDGFHHIWAPYLYDAHIEDRDDFHTLEFLIFSDEEDCVVQATVLGENGEMNISKIKTEKDDENEDVGNKGNDNGDTSISQMDIDNKKGEKKKKKKKSKKENKDGYKSDSSSSSPTLRHHRHHSPSSHRHRSLSSHRHGSSSSRSHRSPSSHRHHTPSRRRHHSPSSSDKHEKIVTYSPSPSPPPCDDEHIDVKVKEEFLLTGIKEEAIDDPQHLFGSYHCEVCNITMNSLLTFNTHVNGKRHRKNMKVKNVSEAVAQNIPATVISEDQSKYPQPPPGVIRTKVRAPAALQPLIEQSIHGPCPGLEYVTEIRGLGDVQYYCAMCDCVCSSNSILSHLSGFKHRVNTVKHFRPCDYEALQKEPKYIIERKIKPILSHLHKKEGMGRMAVEVEELVSDTSAVPHHTQSSTSRDYRSIPSTSKGITKEPGITFPELYDKATIPNMDASDFFCKICQSHMNSLQMWEAHIRGKRHLTNLKKNPGDLPSKTKTILVDKRSYIVDRIKNECRDEPVVGLKEVRETEVPETRSHSYQCFLCGSCHTSLDIVEHLISLKHRTKYLDHINFEGREIISGMSDIAAESLVKDMCVQAERRYGCGKPEVHVNKNAFHR